MVPKRADQRSFVTGNDVRDPSTGALRMVGALPVLDEQNGINAVAIVLADLAWLTQIVTTERLPEGSGVMVTDDRGTVLARQPDHADFTGNAYPDAPNVRTMLASNSEGAAELHGIDGIERFNAWTPMRDDAGRPVMYVAIQLPSEALYSVAQQRLNDNLVMIALMTLVALGAAALFGERFILRDVRTLVGVARAIGGGNLSARSRIGAKPSELGRLGRAIDEMAASLEAHQAERTVTLESLRASEARYRALVHHFPSGVVHLFDHDLRYVLTDGSALAEVAPNPENLVGKTIWKP